MTYRRGWDGGEIGPKSHGFASTPNPAHPGATAGLGQLIDRSTKTADSFNREVKMKFCACMNSTNGWSTTSRMLLTSRISATTASGRKYASLQVPLCKTARSLPSVSTQMRLIGLVNLLAVNAWIAASESESAGSVTTFRQPHNRRNTASARIGG